ncbi:NAD-dependent histone deacetylase SIR2 [Metarhizium acridum CQMa 102]|uniref:NAD-dependent histone deacetylase SIR2 n=1 Tax=Metarhizium acridum (strain CQMa 102) TaxID=655827 RepID=E9E1L9_METAQ|nr:NAD-dependent histone deacetylase SIR2 [Metarhizium acridum CQMa 102]EFY90252.1 NAD-dependent histone deacetylase SIR2 [Metarhizium acridum CQMa 102]
MEEITSSPLSNVTASSPLSSLSKTPSLPSSPDAQPDAGVRYPSPTSTSTSGTQSPIKLGEPVDDSPRPAKKRRITPPRERITTYLNLMKSHDEFSHEDNFHMERLLSALRKKKKIVVVAGAGISVSAGIPDFRSSTGLFATQRSQHKLKASGKHLFDASVYKHESSTSSFHTMVREMSEMSKNAQPTPFHHLLASLAQEGRLLRLYSQNIDCIDTSMKPLQTQIPLEPKAPWPTTIQLHGSLDKMVCTKCGDIQPFQGDIFDGPEAPLCESCKNLDEVRTAHAGKRSHGIGRLRPRFVLYNEFNPDEDAIGNVMRADLRARPDAVLVVGTTLKVPGTRRLVKQLCQVARGRKDGLTAWLNIDPEPKIPDFKDCWDLVVKSTCDNIARTGTGKALIATSQIRSPTRRQNNTRRGPPGDPDSACKPAAAAAAAAAIPTPRASPPPPPPPPQSSGRKPLPEAKQSKLPFGTPKSTTLIKAGKSAKPRGKKPKQPNKAPQPPPTNPLLQTFKASKNVSDTASAKKLGGRSPLPDRKPFKEEPNLVVSLPSPGHDGKTPERITNNHTASPTSPTMPEHQLGETISPKSIPNNMRNLIDVS